MKILEKIIISISLVAIIGSISSLLFSENNYAKKIGYKDMNHLTNVTKINTFPIIDCIINIFTF